tara:strand:+ start:819 stop:1724 length:906 start_codon:yes stop_codon:yes gene_type:complete
MDSGGLIWIPVTLGATAAQVMRTARQHELRGHLSSFGAAYVRFLFAWPLALVSLALTRVLSPQSLNVPFRFYLWIGAAAVVQITGTALLLQAFRARDFAIGTVYSKSEVILVAIGSAIFLNEPLRSTGWVGAVAVLMGVALLAATSGISAALRGLGDRAAWFGVAAGLFFAFSAIGIRGASTSLTGASVWHQTSFTLFALLTFQMLIHGSLLSAFDRKQLIAIWRHRRTCFQVGFLSFAGTTGWIAAMTLASATKVRTLGQLEIVLAFAISLTRLKEHHHLRDYLGSALVLAGILLVVAFG